MSSSDVSAFLNLDYLVERGFSVTTYSEGGKTVLGFYIGQIPPHDHILVSMKTPPTFETVGTSEDLHIPDIRGNIAGKELDNIYAYLKSGNSASTTFSPNPAMKRRKTNPTPLDTLSQKLDNIQRHYLKGRRVDEMDLRSVSSKDIVTLLVTRRSGFFNDSPPSPQLSEDDDGFGGILGTGVEEVLGGAIEDDRVAGEVRMMDFEEASPDQIRERTLPSPSLTTELVRLFEGVSSSKFSSLDETQKNELLELSSDHNKTLKFSIILMELLDSFNGCSGYHCLILRFLNLFSLSLDSPDTEFSSLQFASFCLRTLKQAELPVWVLGHFAISKIPMYLTSFSRSSLRQFLQVASLDRFKLCRPRSEVDTVVEVLLKWMRDSLMNLK